MFGWQHHYCGGASRSKVLFSRLDDYLAHVAGSRPGDHYTLFSLDELLQEYRGAVIEPGTPVWGESSEQPSQTVVVWRSVDPTSETVEAAVFEFERDDDDPDLRDWPSDRGEVMMFDSRLLDEDDFGGAVTWVTPTDRRRRLAVVDAKRPNQEGLVPLHGVY